MKRLLMILLVMSTAFLVSCGDDDDDVLECNNVCAEADHGSTRCTSDNSSFETCTLQANTCYEWVETECTGGEVCIVAPNTTVAACGSGENTGCTSNDDCSGDTPVCSDSGVCVADTTTPECTSNDDCSGDTPVCTAGECVADTTSIDACAVDGCDENGKTECDGDMLQTCTLQPEGCLMLEDTTDCSAETLTPICVDDGTVPAACSVDFP